MTSLSQMNAVDRAGFVAVCGPLFEHSPWIAERTYDRMIGGKLSPAFGARGEGGTEGDGGRESAQTTHNAQRTTLNAERRPFASLAALHQALCQTMYAATLEEQVQLIAAHPDLVGRLAREGQLTRESTTEQAAAGLTRLNTDEVAAFERYNADYRQKFGFPFVICARENKKEAILAAFPVRLNHPREREIQTALGEIAKIARLRLFDAVSDE
jgi:2-oxo-4-hydroxy-4-carboxy-5-ureidoimidazoline decarboxylase